MNIPATGHAGLDEKREKILLALEKVRELHDAGLRGDPLAALANDALDYIEACLGYEETLLAGLRWSGLPAHRALHDLWREKARRLASGGMNRADDGEVFLEYAEKWWETHLLLDTGYARAIADAGLA